MKCLVHGSSCADTGTAMVLGGGGIVSDGAETGAAPMKQGTVPVFAWV